MKRFILSAILLVAFAFAGLCQKHARLSFAASPSVNWMNSTFSGAGNEKAILGYDFGLNGDFYFSEDERYSVFSGIQIINTGGGISYRTNADFKFSGVVLPSLSQITYRLRYAEVPLAIKLKTDQFHRTRYWGLFGLSTMINISARGDSNDGQLKKASIGDEINLFNLAMCVGAGFDFDLGGSNSVTAGLIFQNGLSDVTTNNALSDKTIINSLKLKIGLIF